MFLLVITGAMSAIPASASCFSITSAGLGVILSIMLQGKETLSSSLIYASNSAGTSPFSFHAFTMARTLPLNFSPLWLQLSMLTRATGAAPA